MSTLLTAKTPYSSYFTTCSCQDLKHQKNLIFWQLFSISIKSKQYTAVSSNLGQKLDIARLIKSSNSFFQQSMALVPNLNAQWITLRTFGKDCVIKAIKDLFWFFKMLNIKEFPAFDNIWISIKLNASCGQILLHVRLLYALSF